jgi:hypothetical protein
MDTIRCSLIALVLCAVGCGPVTYTFVVHPSVHANQDRRFYLVVRALKEEEFVADEYGKIAGYVFPPATEKGVRAVRLVNPGQNDEVKVQLADDQPLAVYALFGDPGDPWKVLLTPPLHSRYELTIEGNRIVARALGKPRWRPGKLSTDQLGQLGSAKAPEAPAFPK